MEDFRQVFGRCSELRIAPLIPLLPTEQTLGTHVSAQDCSLLQSPCPSLCPAGLPRDCQELFEEGERQSGLFQIQPQGSLPFLVNCKMTAGRMSWPTRCCCLSVKCSPLPLPLSLLVVRTET